MVAILRSSFNYARVILERDSVTKKRKKCVPFVCLGLNVNSKVYCFFTTEQNHFFPCLLWLDTNEIGKEPLSLLAAKSSSTFIHAYAQFIVQNTHTHTLNSHLFDLDRFSMRRYSVDLYRLIICPMIRI